jgi:hypothetical protein
MAYIGFDLDETLGRFSVAHYHTLFLQPHNVLYRSQWSGLYSAHDYVAEPIPLSSALEAKLERAFTIFAECLVEKELQQPPLGLLRPSMIEIVKRLQELKEEGLVKAVVIYSNNGNLALLHLAGKMIERLAKAPGFFCNYIHWYHPSRSREIDKSQPGVAYKTLSVLLDAFQGGSCGTQRNIPLHNIYFFDDLDPPHRDLQQILRNHYFQISPYKYDAEFNGLNECLKTAMEETGLLEDEEYRQYITPVLRNNITMEGIMQMIHGDQRSYRRRLAKPDDSRLLQTVFAEFPKPISKNNFTKSLQTLRRLEKKQNEGSNLSSEEEQLLTSSRNLITAYERQDPNVSGGKRRFRQTKRQKRSSQKSSTKRHRRNH